MIVAIRNASTDAASTPTRASFWAISSVMDRSTMNSAIVNPIPQSAAPPAMRSTVRPGPNSPTRSSRMIEVDPNTPTNLPTTRATTMPHVRGEVNAPRRMSGLTMTPAFARANSGRMTYATYGA